MDSTLLQALEHSVSLLESTPHKNEAHPTLAPVLGPCVRNALEAIATRDRDVVFNTSGIGTGPHEPGGSIA